MMSEQPMSDAKTLSRAAQRRARKRARDAPDAGLAAPAVAPSSAARAEAALPAQHAAPSAAVLPASAQSALAEPRAGETTSAFQLTELAMPTAEDDLFDALQLALGQARTITGRKYRYGATLLAGEDAIPLKQGSNKKQFQRANIHAEMAALKGCTRSEGKDMLVARVAPVRTVKRDNSSSDSDSDSDSGGGRRKGGAPAAPPPAGKVLNARPCARCEARMVERGVRRCYFTIDGARLGVLEYNPDAT